MYNVNIGSASVFLGDHNADSSICIVIGSLFIHGTPKSIREFAGLIEAEVSETEAKRAMAETK